MFSTSTSSLPPPDRILDRLLIVEAGGAMYGFPGDALHEIVPLGAVTRLPGAPDFVHGLMNVRGTMLCVIDLSRRMRGEPLRSESASVVVIQSSGRVLGVAVDDVLDVVDTGGAELEPVPQSAVGPLARGLGHFGGRVVIVIDANELVRQALA
ncbi:MAG: Chemotaxis protein CheW [Gemmatimonadaceae bacterium]|nr:Chemotaxis protein CheW [Gemmatimonadaceae bacterium]